MTCEWKIRPFSGDTELQCQATGPHSRHEANLRDFAYRGSQTLISWYPGDRREFRGDYPGKCPEACSLPA